MSTSELMLRVRAETRMFRSRVGEFLRATRAGLFVMALIAGVGAGLGAVGFRYLIFSLTWLFTGHDQFGQAGRVASDHFAFLSLGFYVLIPIIGGLLYGPLIYNFAREARGHGVPEVMIAVAEEGGRIRPRVAAVKSLASALCIAVGGSVGREGPIVQIGSALTSSLGQYLRVPESRLRILVSCGAGAGIAATFNAPITGIFFGVEIILRAFSIEAIFTVMLSCLVADIISRAFFGSAPFLSGFPRGIALPHVADYGIVLLLAVVAGLLGLLFKAVLYKVEDICDAAWRNRPEWARPAVGGVVLGLLLLAVPQLYGVGYPAMYDAIDGKDTLWLLVVLCFGKIIATSLSIGIGGSGGIFAPSLFIGAAGGMAVGTVAGHIFGADAGQSALYAAVGMGAVFASAARAPLASLASVVEMTGDYGITLPVMAAVAVASAISRALSYGTIYTTKLLRRGTDVDRVNPLRGLEELAVQDVMHHFPIPLPAAPEREFEGCTPDSLSVSLGNVTYEIEPRALLANESLGQALRQLGLYGRDGLPVLSTDGQQLLGWITNQQVIEGLSNRIEASNTELRRNALLATRATSWAAPEPAVVKPISGYHVVEIALGIGSPAVGKTIAELNLPPGCMPVSVVHDRQLHLPDASTELAVGDRLNVLLADLAETRNGEEP